jgi:hypothetical protein
MRAFQTQEFSGVERLEAVVAGVGQAEESAAVALVA